MTDNREIRLAVNQQDVERILEKLYADPKTFNIAKQVAKEWKRLSGNSVVEQ